MIAPAAAATATLRFASEQKDSQTSSQRQPQDKTKDASQDAKDGYKRVGQQNTDQDRNMAGGKNASQSNAADKIGDQFRDAKEKMSSSAGNMGGATSKPVTTDMPNQKQGAQADFKEKAEKPV